VESLEFTLASGEKTFRPMGLTDIPGGAGSSGVYAAVFGLGFLFAHKRIWIRAFDIATVLLGMIAVMMSQVRVSFVVLVISLVGTIALFAGRHGVRRSASLIFTVVGAALAAYI